MSRTSEFQSELRCGCGKCLAKDGQIKCRDCKKYTRITPGHDWTLIMAYLLSTQAVVNHVLTRRLPIKLSVRSTGRSMGHVQFDEPEMALCGREDLVNQLTAVLAEPAAEEKLTGTITPSSRRAYERARNLALQIIGLYGSSAIEEKVSAYAERWRSRGGLEEDLPFFAKVHREACTSRAILGLTDQCSRRAKQLLHDYNAAIAMLTEKLLAAGELDADALRDLLSSL
jgi:ATP-dependent Zn protease